jgi:1-phosphofructokinase family hexose kinase
VLVATPNLTVDRTVRLAALVPGAVLRPRRAVVTAGGKGLNVARVLAALGARAELLGFLPEADSTVMTELFGREPVTLHPVPVAGEARVATILIEDSGRVTVLNEPGPQISAESWGDYEDHVRTALASGRHRTLVCSGSLPPGAPDDGYGRLCRIARAAGVRTVVDAARGALAAVLPAGPDIVTPNLGEAEGVLSGAGVEAVEEAGDDVVERASDAVRALCKAGARTAVVTAGAAGAAYGDAASVVWVPTVPVDVVNPIGAGDSFVGGLVDALEQGRDPLECVAAGVGTATASCEQELAGGVDPRRASELTRAVLAQIGATAGGTRTT